MNCRCAQNLLSAFIDGELAGVEMIRVRDHLTTCTSCREEVESLRAMKRMLGMAKQIEPPMGFEDRLATMVLVAKDNHRVSTPTWRLALTTSLAAAAVVFVLLQVTRPATPTSASNPTVSNVAFDVQSDQSYVATSDPFGGQAPVMPVSQK